MKIKLNHIIYSVIFILSFTNTFGQIRADAGPDRVVCYNEGIMDTITLGGNPSGSGGNGNYTYCWEALKHYTGSQYYWFASYFLDDTTAANPRLLHVSSSDLVFHLTVTDEKKNIGYDTCKISRPYFAVTNLDVILYITEGDSVSICYNERLYSRFPVDSVSWNPQVGLSTPFDSCTWAHPGVNTTYSAFVMDSAGCYVNTPVCDIRVIPEEIMVQNSSFIRVFCEDKTIRISGWRQFEKPEISLYNLNGQLILNEIIRDEIDIGTINEGVVFYSIHDNEKVLTSGKLLLY